VAHGAGTPERQARVDRLLERLPPRVPLDMKVLEKRIKRDHEEWQVEYASERFDPALDARAGRIPAYVLVPRGDDFKAPFPAMVCWHQCSIDCDLGSDSVVGKVVDRPDQAYGLELVRQGFVVIAPDTWGCGRRHIPGVRAEGECLVCHHPGRDYTEKAVLDALCTVDVLESLDVVDPARIGAIGHSMGSHTTILHMAHDRRVRAGIVSGNDGNTHGRFESYGDALALIAPRLFMQLQGELDGPVEAIERVKAAHRATEPAYARSNAEDDLVLRLLPCGHYFHDDFKREAYTRLKLHFGLARPRARASLGKLLEEARQNTWSWDRVESHFPAIQGDLGATVVADRDALLAAFTDLFVNLYEKRPLKSALNVEIHDDRDEVLVVCRVAHGDDRAPVGKNDLRPSLQTLFEHAGSLSTHDEGGIRYELRLRKPDRDEP